MAQLLREIRASNTAVRQLHLGQVGMATAALVEALAFLRTMVTAAEVAVEAGGGGGGARKGDGWWLDLRGNAAPPSDLSDGFAEMSRRILALGGVSAADDAAAADPARQPARQHAESAAEDAPVVLHLPADPWPMHEAELDDGWHRSGLPPKRVMWSTCSETVVFLEGDEDGAAPFQAPVVIEEPGGELNSAALVQVTQLEPAVHAQEVMTQAPGGDAAGADHAQNAP